MAQQQTKGGDAQSQLCNPQIEGMLRNLKSSILDVFIPTRRRALRLKKTNWANKSMLVTMRRNQVNFFHTMAMAKKLNFKRPMAMGKA